MTIQPTDPPPGGPNARTDQPEGLNLDALTREITSKTTKAELIEMVEAERYRNGHVHIKYSQMDGFAKGMEEKVRRLELALKDAEASIRELEHTASSREMLIGQYADACRNIREELNREVQFPLWKRLLGLRP